MCIKPVRTLYKNAVHQLPANTGSFAVLLYTRMTTMTWHLNGLLFQYTLSEETINYLKQPTFDIWHWETNEVSDIAKAPATEDIRYRETRDSFVARSHLNARLVPTTCSRSAQFDPSLTSVTCILTTVAELEHQYDTRCLVSTTDLGSGFIVSCQKWTWEAGQLSRVNNGP